MKELPLDGRSDLFSLGCVLYEALSGSPAFEGQDERSLMFQVLERGPGDLRQRCPELPEAITSVVLRALQRSVEERFQTADEMRAALSACVPKLSAFSLEESTSSVIRGVLGERIREREEAMFLAFQRFAPSQFERTDTLPIAGTVRAPDSRTLRTALPEQPPQAQSAARDPGSGGRTASAARRPVRRHLVVALVFVAVALGSYASYTPWRPEPAAEVSSVRSLHPSPSSRLGTGPSGTAGSDATPGTDAPGTSASDEAALGKANVAESAPALPREVPFTTVKRRKKEASSLSPAPPRARSESTTPKTSPSPPKPFEWQFPDDPYAQPSTPRPAPPRER